MCRLDCNGIRDSQASIENRDLQRRLFGITIWIHQRLWCIRSWSLFATICADDGKVACSVECSMNSIVLDHKLRRVVNLMNWGIGVLNVHHFCSRGHFIETICRGWCRLSSRPGWSCSTSFPSSFLMPWRSDCPGDYFHPIIISIHDQPL